jgi:hypothetical protein
MLQGTISAVTDGTGGTASTTALFANATPATVDGAATTSAPKAGFDAELNVIENAVAELASVANVLLRSYSLPALVDNTAQSVNGALEALGVALVAVDGSSGASALDAVTAGARMATINNALSSLAAKLNALAPYFGVTTLTDSLGGVVSGTLANVAATGAGVSGVASTMLNTAVNTWLTNNRNNVATLAAKLNQMIGTNAVTRPLHVVAG